MSSKAEEDVRKRRAKGKPGSSRVYPKLVLLVGVIGVLVAIGLNPRMAPILSAAIIGLTVVGFFWLKRRQPQGKEEEKASPADSAPDLFEKGTHLYPITAEAGEKELDLGKEPEETVKPPSIPEIFSENKPEEQDLPKEEQASVQESAASIEERLAVLEEKLAKLEEKVAAIQEVAPGWDGKVDLQKIFSQMDENAEKSAKAHRSYLVHTEDPAP